MPGEAVDVVENVQVAGAAAVGQTACAIDHQVVVRGGDETDAGPSRPKPIEPRRCIDVYDVPGA
jgi:hypothetical protein